MSRLHLKTSGVYYKGKKQLGYVTLLTHTHTLPKGLYRAVEGISLHSRWVGSWEKPQVTPTLCVVIQLVITHSIPTRLTFKGNSSPV